MIRKAMVSMSLLMLLGASYGINAAAADDSAAKQINALNTQIQAQLQKMNETNQAQLKKMQSDLQKQINDGYNKTQAQIKKVQDGMQKEIQQVNANITASKAVK